MSFREQVPPRKNTFPNPLEIRLGKGMFVLQTFTGAEKGEAPGIIIRPAIGTNKVGNLCPARVGVREPEPGEVYIVLENIEAAVVLQGMLTATMQRLCGFPEYKNGEQ